MTCYNRKCGWLSLDRWESFAQVFCYHDCWCARVEPTLQVGYPQKITRQIWGDRRFTDVEAAKKTKETMPRLPLELRWRMGMGQNILPYHIQHHPASSSIIQHHPSFVILFYGRVPGFGPITKLRFPAAHRWYVVTLASPFTGSGAKLSVKCWWGAMGVKWHARRIARLFT